MTSGGDRIGSTNRAKSPDAVGCDPHFLIFLLIGQSNMEGQPAPQPVDKQTQPRIMALGYDNNAALGRTYNEWHVASPPLHSGDAGVGPGDYFARTMLKALPPQYSIGLVPLGINGVDIDFFRKGVTSSRRGEFTIPPDNAFRGAYEWILSRARRAQQAGVIRGILFHQGESDSGQAAWPAKVQAMVSDLRADLELGEDTPFLVGELYYDGACASHNELIAQLPASIPNCTVVSAMGLGGIDPFHFDLPAQRTLGARYGEKMLGLLKFR